jgi:hypothetical protein
LIKLPELHAKTDERVGIILCPPEWFSYDHALRLELLSGWIYGLQRLHEATEVQMNTDDAIRKAMKK